MSVKEPAPMTLVWSPPRYPEPSYGEDVEVTMIILAATVPVGYLVWNSPDNVAAIPLSSLETPEAWATFRAISAELNAGAKAKTRAVDARRAILSRYRHKPVTTRLLDDLVHEAYVYVAGR